MQLGSGRQSAQAVSRGQHTQVVINPPNWPGGGDVAHLRLDPLDVLWWLACSSQWHPSGSIHLEGPHQVLPLLGQHQHPPTALARTRPLPSSNAFAVEHGV